MAVHEYNLTNQGNKFLSPHFQVKEFRSYNDSSSILYSYEVKIEEELIQKLEVLFERLHCSSIRINSGYRTLEHEKALGGSGNGQHVKGKAADIVCYD
ncbi:MAG: D-Ala-D-Ala carboxypeptidase family metallohydrolase, partial [Thermoflexaceae bacterium]|nr:D-Ala-D-Ala carboxypeptidase family metallohydrolase [Thermoflexaceae bacterium]